jgi:hypothetical protein
VAREPLRREREDVVARLERRVDHPVDGKHQHDEHGQAERVQPDLPQRLVPSHLISPIRIICRM